MVSCSMPETTETCLPLLVTAAVRRSGVPVKKDLALRLSSNLQPVPRAFNDFDAGARQTCMRAHEPLAKREAKDFDRAAGVTSSGGVNHRFESFARKDRRRTAFDERFGEVAFEAAGDREIASVMAIAAPDHS